MLSFWEQQAFAEYDFAVIGAGIMGCSVAFELRTRFPDASIIVLERGIFPAGASTRNAGFACFGSPTEIRSDMNMLGEEKALNIISKRFEGLRILEERFNDEMTGRTRDGGYELIFSNPFNKNDIDALNEALLPVFPVPVFKDASAKIREFGFQGTNQLISCTLESQLDSGKMMYHYWKLLYEKNVRIVTGASVERLDNGRLEVRNDISGPVQIKADSVFICTNAFIGELVPDLPVVPGRGQVLLTNELTDLPFSGSFHFDEGYYYFRNVGRRVLFGGGRNLDFTTEQTLAFSSNDKIVADLKNKLKDIILPGREFEIEYQWQGIMGFSDDKLPVVRKLSEHVTYVMSCNGMGVALSPLIAREVVSAL